MTGIFPRDSEFGDEGKVIELRKPQNLPNIVDDVSSLNENRFKLKPKEVNADQHPEDLGNLSELDEEDFDWDDELPPTSEQELMLQPGKPNPEDQLERSRLEEYWNSRHSSRRELEELCQLGYDVPDCALRTCAQLPTKPGKNPCETTINADLMKDESK